MESIQWRGANSRGDFKSAGLKRYDLSNPEVRKWFTEVAVAATAKSCDGIFMDAFPQILSPANVQLWGEEKYEQVQAGLFDLLSEVREAMGEDKLILQWHQECARSEFWNAIS